MDKEQAVDMKAYRSTYYTYVGSFAVIVVLILIAFSAVELKLLAGAGLVALLLILATVQLVLQLKVFLEVGDEKPPHYIKWGVVYTFAMMLVVVLGSIWIMNNMNYNMHFSPEQMKEFMLKQNKKGF